MTVVLPKVRWIRLRRICLKTHDAERKEERKKRSLTIAPSIVMPCFVGMTNEIEKALFLRRFDVPFWALTDVFGAI